MKKTFSLLTICASFAALNASGQGYGYFLFQSSPKAVWENFTTGGPIVPAPANSVNVAFLIGTGTPLIGTSGTSTNAESITYFGPLFSDPNFHFATDANTGQIAVGTTIGYGLSLGAFGYNSRVAFPVAGTTAGATYNVFVVGWESYYATPQAAAAAGGLFGWSNTFSYQSGTSINPLLTFSASGMSPLGLVIPEPSTLSLASLGALAITAVRRRPA